MKSSAKRSSPKSKTKRPDPQQPYVGTYRCGLTNVELYGLTTEFGGQFWVAPDRVSLPRIKIGFGYNHWWEVVATLLHESFEYLCAQRDARLIPCGTSMRASDIYQFYFDHKAFSLIVEDQAYFTAKCLPDLAAAWKKFHKNQD